MIKKIKRLYTRRKAVSPVVAALLLIALTVAAVAIIYFLIVPIFNTYKLEGELYLIKDTNKDSMYDHIGLILTNYGTKTINVTQITVWTCIYDDLQNSSRWLEHKGWTFTNPSASLLTASTVNEVTIDGDEQIGLSVRKETYYRLQLSYTGGQDPFYSDWARLNEFVDLSDLLATFENFNLTANGFNGTIDDPGRAANNYVTNPDGDYQLLENQINLIEVLDESELIPFYVGTQIVVFHSPNGNLSLQPLVQTFDVSANPFKAEKFFILGLTGSWGDEFPVGDWALNMTIIYTDDSFDNYELNHSYIDDWWYGANPGDVCISAPDGLVTEIDLGTQADTPHSHIHTHSTRFFMDYFKYVKAIIFEDPGDDNSGPHLLALTIR
ncbi:MAG: archaellin/type IV pilin N-terminal domain-containing protein [Candidatus Heimdallarchaeota archaeon]